MTLSAGEVRRLLAEHGLRPRRSLGQNFVVDPNTLRRIARLSGAGPGDHVLEIGAGLGSLSLALAETGAEVLAVEVDHELVPLLRQVVAGQRVRVVETDALRLDWRSLLETPNEPVVTWRLVANLPYNVATPLVLSVLEGAPTVGSLLVMVQREVGERLAAGVGNPAYGAPSVKVAYWCRAEVVGRVPASVFYPRPEVESVLVRLLRRPAPAVAPEVVGYERLFAVVGAGFAQRRKMLRRSLAGVVEPAAFEAAGIDPAARAEELSVQEWGRLAAWPGPEAAP